MTTDGHMNGSTTQGNRENPNLAIIANRWRPGDTCLWLHYDAGEVRVSHEADADPDYVAGMLRILADDIERRSDAPLV